MFDTKRGVERQPAGSKEPAGFRSATQVAEWLQISRKTLERMIGDGRFPQPEFKVEGRRTRRWHASQLEAWRARQRGDEALVSIAGSGVSTS
jgi:excisionase family DNA binding protein